MKEALALAVLAVSLAAAITRSRRVPDWEVATVGALLLLVTGVVSGSGVRAELHRFVRLGLLVVPAALCAATLGLWLALKVV